MLTPRQIWALMEPMLNTIGEIIELVRWSSLCTGCALSDLALQWTLIVRYVDGASLAIARIAA